MLGSSLCDLPSWGLLEFAAHFQKVPTLTDSGPYEGVTDRGKNGARPRYLQDLPREEMCGQAYPHGPVLCPLPQVPFPEPSPQMQARVSPGAALLGQSRKASPHIRMAEWKVQGQAR